MPSGPGQVEQASFILSPKALLQEDFGLLQRVFVHPNILGFNEIFKYNPWFMYIIIWA